MFERMNSLGGVIGCAITVHRTLGCGLLESAYDECLAYELVKNGFGISRHAVMPVLYDGVRIELGYKPDLIVNEELIVELKAVTQLLPVHEAQLLTYLRLSGITRGLLMNFHSQPLVKGIKRMVLSPNVPSFRSAFSAFSAVKKSVSVQPPA